MSEHEREALARAEAWDDGYKQARRDSGLHWDQFPTISDNPIIGDGEPGWICHLCGCWNRYAGRCKYYDEAHERYDAGDL